MAEQCGKAEYSATPRPCCAASIYPLGWVAGKKLLLRSNAADTSATSSATGNISVSVSAMRNNGFLYCSAIASHQRFSEFFVEKVLGAGMNSPAFDR